jgi:hypothetical protein
LHPSNKQQRKGDPMMNRFFLKLQKAINLNSLLGIFGIVCVTISAPAFADGVMVAPTRIILEGGSRSEQMIIVNNSKKPQTYRATFRNMAFTSEGYTEVTEPKDGQLFSDSMIRVSTREIRLKPGQTQVLRILLRKPEDLAPGEYRSHLTLTGLPDVANPLVSEKLNDNLAIRVLPVYSYTFPVMVRNGPLSASIKDSQIRLLKSMPDGSAEMQLDVSIEGSRSLFFDAFLEEKDTKKKSTSAMQVKNMSVYWPANRRLVNFILTKEQYAKYQANGYVLKVQEVNNIGAPIVKQSGKTL